MLDGGNWLLQNENLQGELDKAAEKVGFGPAMRALVEFPSVVDMMCQDGIVWQRDLGADITQFNPDEAWTPIAIEVDDVIEEEAVAMD